MKAAMITLLALALTAPAASASFGGVEAPFTGVREKAKVVKKAKPKPKKPARHDLWVRIGRCEQPGRGYMGVYWSHPGPRYQGGLGFYSGTWAAFKEPWMPSNAGAASWRAQMQVANKLYARYGTSPWGCG